MFTPKTDKIKYIFELVETPLELEKLFVGKIGIYLDWANILGWTERTKFHIDVKRLKQFLDSFDSISNINLYYGKLENDKPSEDFMSLVENLKYKVITKLVKILHLSINVSSVEKNNPSLLKSFIKKNFLSVLKNENIANLNLRLEELNNQKIWYVEERKCNFDVEIGRDMILDAERGIIDTFILWSGDSDFAVLCEYLISLDKKVVICNTSGKISRELNLLREKGVVIFDIKKIKEYICYNKEIDLSVQAQIAKQMKSQRGPLRGP